MPDWLQTDLVAHSPILWQTMIERMLIAFCFGMIIAITYRISHGRNARDARTMVGTLVLLTMLLAMVTMVIGDSVARAFGLVGALSIVRFRTVVEDTRDTAFVIFAVVVGMAVGTGLLLIAVVGVPLVSLAAFFLAWDKPLFGAFGARADATTPTSTLLAVVRMNAGQSHIPVQVAMSSAGATWRVAAITTARQGTAMDLTYRVQVRDTPGAEGVAAAELVAAINAVPGVQSVDLRSADMAE